MMECPRCKFVQPEDRFCANCGLNIEAFAAKPKPLMQKVLANPFFYVVLAVISAIVLTQVGKKTTVNIVEQKGLVATATQPVANNESAPSAAPAPTPPARPAAAANRIQTPPTPPPATARVAPGTQLTAAVEPDGVLPADATTATAPTANAKNTSEPPKPPPAQMDLIFYEIARESWVTLSSEGKSAGEQNGWRALAFSNRERLQATLVNARRLPGVRQMNTQPSSAASLHFQVGVGGTPPTPQGLFVDMSVVKLDASTMELEVMGQVDLKHEGNQESHQKAAFVSSFNPSGALVINGMIPRKTLADPATHPTAGTPLTALESPDYIEGQSEVVLVIQGK